MLFDCFKLKFLHCIFKNTFFFIRRCTLQCNFTPQLQVFLSTGVLYNVILHRSKNLLFFLSTSVLYNVNLHRSKLYFLSVGVLYNVSLHPNDETKIFIIIFDILSKFQRIIINRLRYPIFVLKYEKYATYFL